MNNLPLVTIGIPSYNYGHFILSALNSAAAQDYDNIEVIIVDDSSTDNSVEVIENWMKDYSGKKKARLIKNTKNVGLTKVCNIILQNAWGKYFQVLDADDLLMPQKISRQVELLEKNSDAALIYSNICVIDGKGALVENDYLGKIGYDKNNMPQGTVFRQLFDFNFIPLPSVLVNTQKAMEAGGFNEEVHVQDYYLWIKLAQKHKLLYLTETTACYRIHESSMSNSNATNPRSVDSIMTILYQFYATGDKEIKKKIKKNIHNSCLYLYEFNYPTTAYWLKTDLLINPGIKHFIYLLARMSGIPFSFFKSIKTLAGNQ